MARRYSDYTGKLDQWLPPAPTARGFDVPNLKAWEADLHERKKLLFEYYLIAYGDWENLALALARDHVKGFQTKPKRGAPKTSDSIAALRARRELLSIVRKKAGGDINRKVNRICDRLAEKRDTLPLFYHRQPSRKLAETLKKEVRRALREEARMFASRFMGAPQSEQYDRLEELVEELRRIGKN